MEDVPIESYPALSAVEGLVHGLLCRVPGLDLSDADKDVALRRLRPAHDRALESMGLAGGIASLDLAEQVRGAEVAWVCADQGPMEVAGADGLACDSTGGAALGVFVADCCAVWVVDPLQKAFALVHSGKEGTKAKIVVKAIELLEEQAGSRAKDLIVQLSPCIRPPAYEVDFAAQIRADAVAAGVPESQVHDPGVCTSSDPERYYSYRGEKGKTGRMLAVVAWP